MENRNTPQENLAVIEYLLEQRNILRTNLEAYENPLYAQEIKDLCATGSADGLEDYVTHSADANQIQDLNDAVQGLRGDVKDSDELINALRLNNIGLDSKLEEREEEIQDLNDDVQMLTRSLKDANIVISMKEKTIDLKLDETRELYAEIDRLKEQYKTSVNVREQIISTQAEELDKLRRFKCETQQNNHDNERWDFENEGLTSKED